MAVKRYDGSAWQTVAGLGAQGAAATSSSIATWVKTASGGETSLSGNDDSSQALSYTVGQELVFINGTLLKRGSDYTATNGTSITGLTALAANDVATVWTVNAFSVTGAIANTIVDAKGDLLVGTAVDTPGRIAVGTDGQVLTAASTTGTGLTWATPAAGGMTLISTTAASGGSVSLTSIAGTYKHLLVVMTDVSTSSSGNLKIQFNSDTTATRYRWTHIRGNGTTLSMVTDYEDAQILVAATDGILGSNLGNLDNTSGAFWVYNYTQNPLKTVWGRVSSITTNEKLCEFDGLYNETAAVSSIQLTPTAGTYTGGNIFLYGVA